MNIELKELEAKELSNRIILLEKINDIKEIVDDYFSRR